MESQISIPTAVRFQDLQLRRNPVSGAIAFSWTPIAQICEASGIALGVFQDGPEDNVAGLILQWYQRHREAGGTPDPVAETLLAEVEAEDEFGPGRVQRGPGSTQ